MKDARLEAIDNAIGNLEDDREDLVREIQAACEHEWNDDCLFAGARYCPKCSLYDHTNSCTRIELPEGFTWPYDVPVEQFCWKHKRATVECRP